MTRTVHICIGAALLSSFLWGPLGCSDRATKRSDREETAADEATTSLDDDAGRIDYVGQRQNGQYRLYGVGPGDGERCLLRVLAADDSLASRTPPQFADDDAALNRRWQEARGVSQRRTHDG